MKKYLGVLRYFPTWFGIIKTVVAIVSIILAFVIPSKYPDTSLFIRIIIVVIACLLALYIVTCEAVPQFKEGYRCWYLDTQQYIIEPEEEDDTK